MSEEPRKWTEEDQGRLEQIEKQLQEHDLTPESAQALHDELQALYVRRPRSLVRAGLRTAWREEMDAPFRMPAWQAVDKEATVLHEAGEYPGAKDIVYHPREGFDTLEDALAYVRMLSSGDLVENGPVSDQFFTVGETTEADIPYWYQEFIATRVSAMAASLMDHGLAEGYLSWKDLNIEVLEHIVGTHLGEWYGHLQMVNTHPVK